MSLDRGKASGHEYALKSDISWVAWVTALMLSIMTGRIACGRSRPTFPGIPSSNSCGAPLHSSDSSCRLWYKADIRWLQGYVS